MNLYYFTFGQRYSTQTHPQGGHPDGWFTIEAPDEEAARDRMVKLCGKKWATSYDSVPDLETFPRGEIRRVLWDEVIAEPMPEPTNQFTYEIGVRVPMGKLFQEVGRLEDSLNETMHGFGFSEKATITSILPLSLKVARELNSTELRQFADVVEAEFKAKFGYAKIEYFNAIEG